MASTIEYAKSARDQLKKLDKPAARRIVDYMEQRIAPLENPRSVGKALQGPLGELWRYRVGDFRIICDIQDKKLTILVLQVGNRKDIHR